MKPDSITGVRSRGVCFLHDGFEAGTEFFHNSIWPYCAWVEDGKPTAIGNISIENWDQLLLRLIDENIDAAKWLLCHRPPLCMPKGTILTLVRAGIINADAAGETISVSLLPSNQLSEISDLLQFYSWEPADVGRADRKFTFPDRD